MIRKFLILSVLVLSILTSTACRNLQQDTGEVKVIEKPKSEDTAAQNQGNIPKQNTTPNTQNSDLNEKGEILQSDTEEYIKNIINDRAAEVLTAIKNYDMEKLSRAVHPNKGVRFTPYSYIDKSKDLVFSAEEIKSIGAETTKYLWGSYDGSGEPIELTFSDYYKKFIYDEDFINAKEIGYNKTLGKGNSLNNSFAFYKNSIIVEYYFPGFDPQYQGIDWRSLRLVFEKMNDTWYIVGIIHDQWTI